MRTTRRQFMSHSTAGGLGVLAISLRPADVAAAFPLRPITSEAAEGEGIAASLSRYYRFRPDDEVRQADAAAWIQIDLGACRTIDAVRLHPPADHAPSGGAQPVRFRIDCAEDPVFRSRTPLLDWQAPHFSARDNFIARFPERAAEARYLRLEATPLDGGNGGAAQQLQLAAVEILSGGAVLRVAVEARPNSRWRV